MTQATATVVNKFILQGKNQASKALGDAAKSVDGVTKALKRASARSDQLASTLRSAFQGDILGSLEGLKGALGQASGLAGVAGLAAGASVALTAAAGGAAVAFTKWSIEIERTNAALDAAFGGQGFARALDLAQRVGGVGAESVGKLASSLKLASVNATVTVEQMQELTARATAAGKSGDEALNAFADAVRNGEAGALKMVGTIINGELAIKRYAEAVGVSSERLTAQQRSTAILQAVQEDLTRSTGATTATFAAQDNVLARLDNAWESLKHQLSEIGSGPMVDLADNVAEVIEIMGRWSNVVVAVGKVIALQFTVPLKAAIAIVTGFGAAVAAGMQGGFKALDAVLMQLDNDLKNILVNGPVDAFKGLADAYGKAMAPTAKVVTKTLDVVGDPFKALTDTVGTAGAALDHAAKRAAKIHAQQERARAAARAAAARARAEAARFDAQFMGDVDKGNKADAAGRVALENQEARALAKTLEDIRLVKLQTRRDELTAAAVVDPAARMRLQLLDLEESAHNRIRQIKNMAFLETAQQSSAIAAVEQRLAAQRAKLHTDEMKRIQAEMLGRVSSALAIGRSAVQGLEMFEGANRAAAGFKAALSFAEAGLAFVQGRYDQVAAGLVAGATFTKMAVNGGNEGSGVQSALGGSGAFPSASGPAPLPAPAAATPATTVMNFYGIATTRAEVGRGIKMATHSMQGTGYT